MLTVYGIKTTFEILFVLTVVIAGLLTLANLYFWIRKFVFFIKNRFKKRNNISKDSPTQPRFKDFIAGLTKKESYLNFFKAFLKKETYRFLKTPSFWLILFTIGGGIFVFQSLQLMFNGFPDVTNRYPLSEQEWSDPDRPIMVEFDRPIDQDKLKFYLVPEIEGDIRFEKSFDNLPFSRRVYFYPKKSLEPNFTLYNYVSGIHALWNNEQRYDHEVYFQSYKTPTIVSSSIKDNAEDVLLDANFVFTFDKDLDDYTNFDFEFSPLIEFDKIVSGNTISIKPKSALKLASPYKITVFRTVQILNLESKEVINKLPAEEITSVNFTTVKSPQIKSASPTGNAAPVNSEIKIEFTKEMDPDSVIAKLSVSPNFSFTPVWNETNTAIVLKTSTSLEYGQAYEIKIAAGAKGKGDTVLETDFSYKFTTAGDVKVVRTSPANGAANIDIQSSIKVTFDQPVDKNSAQSKFSVNPSFEYSIAWDGDIMIVKPNASYPYLTKFTYSIASGVASVYGKPSTKTYTYSFTTKEQVFSLNVPLYKQTPYPFGCNVTAASMLMNYKGVKVTNYQIYTALPKSTPTNRSGNTWGDPDLGYVGNIDKSPGYGVHWGPISNYMTSRGVSNTVYHGMSASQLAHEIEAGRPAMIWWWNEINKNANGGPIAQSWVTEGGRTINTIIGMHSEVVIGFYGPADNPTAFILNDPRGSRRVVAISRFNYLWGILGNTALVVN